MKKITALTAQKRNKERVNVFLDGEYAFSLTLVTAAYLRTGQELSDEKIAALRLEDEYERCKEAALTFIGYRPRSEQEVRRKLKEKEFAADTIERVVERLTELNLLSDKAFSRYWVEQRETFKPRSQRALRQELMQKGIAREEVDAAVDAVDETAAAMRAGAKKAGRWAELPPDQFRQKITQFLLRRGFNYETIQYVARALWDDVKSERGDNP